MAKIGRAGKKGLNRKKVWINLAKWLIAPPLAVALGFYVLGPRIGSNPLVEEKANDLKDAVTGVAEATVKPSAPEKPKGRYSNVELKIDVVDDDGKKVPEAPKPKYFTENAGQPAATEPPKADETGASSDPDAEPTSLPDTGGW